MTQWVWRNRDHNVTCPAIESVTTPMWVRMGRAGGVGRSSVRAGSVRKNMRMIAHRAEEDSAKSGHVPYD